MTDQKSEEKAIALSSPSETINFSKNLPDKKFGVAESRYEFACRDVKFYVSTGVLVQRQILNHTLNQQRQKFTAYPHKG